jgi:hypothetical protein
MVSPTAAPTGWGHQATEDVIYSEACGRKSRGPQGSIKPLLRARIV